MNQVVKSSTMLWSEQVAIAEAATELDYAGAGVAGIEAMVEKRQPVIYNFANGRQFRRPVDPYA